MESEADGAAIQVAEGDAARPADQPEATGPTLIASIEGDRDAASDTQRIWEILADWRTADRALAAMEPGSPGWNDAHAKLVGLRAHYHSLFVEECATAIKLPRMALMAPPWFDRYESIGAVDGVDQLPVPTDTDG